MATGMRVTVKEYESVPAPSQYSHKAAEGIGDPVREHTFTNVYNIEQHNPDPGTDTYPRIVIRDSDGEHTFASAIPDVSDTEPRVTVTAIRDITPSDVKARTTTLNAYGFQTETVTDTFGDEVVIHGAYVRDQDGDPAVLHSNHRGYIVTYPDGTTQHYGDTSRHSRTAQKYIGDTIPHDPPYKTDTGHMTVHADGDTYHGVVNTSRPSVDTYALHTVAGNTIHVSEITDVEGALYTVAVRHKDTFGYGKETTTVQNAMGVYVSAEHNVGSHDLAVFAVGHPDSAGVHKTPYLHQLTKVENVENVFVKHPDGTVTTGLENIPNVDES